MGAQFSVGGRDVGPGNPCYVIAEIGSNHNNDYGLAIETIDAAVAAGVDAVKFQTFRAADHYSKKTPGFTYLDGQNTYDLIKSLEMDRDWLPDLAKHAASRNVDFLSSPCDQDAIERLEAVDVPTHKVASFDLPDLQLIRAIAQTGKPVVLSTGLANMDDIERAVATCRGVGNEQICLLQCTSLYPAPTHLSNLRAIATLRDEFDVVSGYSDHTEGDVVPVSAVALGASMIEKHFTLDRALPGPDHPFAINPAEMTEMMRKIRDVESALGDGVKNGPREEEQEMFEKGRRSLHAKITIPAGSVISEDMIVCKRPGYGIAPHQLPDLVGCRTTETIDEDAWINWAHVAKLDTTEH